MNGVIKCLVLCPNSQDATSFYRAAGPFAVMRKQFPIEFHYATAVDWPTLSNHDLVFFQRPFNAAHLQAFNTAKDMGIPTWVDYDDDILNIPMTNPAYGVFKNNHCKDILAKADLVTVTTESLASVYAPFRDGKPITIIPNCAMVPPAPEPSPKREQPVILWRGSPSHIGDTGPLKQWLDNPKFKDAKIVCVGHLPSELADDPRLEYIPWIQLFDFYKYIRTLAPNYIMVPLASNGFNDCKSNIAWLEGLSCGAVVLASPVAEFKHVTHDEFINMPVEEAFEKQCERVKHYQLQDWNLKRFESVCEILGLKVSLEKAS